ncbi:3-hydroxyacyl-ACP dehydratase FabZ [Helicobacter mesocricetorum]|uniref:3-hydroxyacyl-ACP dehydratase FabZ n=1 Tax=Helicobacter mesocricetorum TaxID=87012 RepID=UPI000CF02FC5|nr:3-hydroxyacyl-ACP dehydratase FabZ [Helicobacter mesocricetorum]
MLYDVQKIKEILPHRYPLLLVDRIIALTPNKSIEAYKNITINEEVFNGHFPIQPIYPGVYIIEGMAQAGGVLAFVSMFGEDSNNRGDKIVYFMSIDKAKFRNPVSPGDKLVYKLEVVKQKGGIWVLQGYAYVEDKLVAEAELKAMIVDKNQESQSQGKNK